MKHIKKKFLFQEFLNKHKDFPSEFEEVSPDNIDSKLLKEKAKSKSFAIIKTVSNESVLCLIYNNNGSHCLIPVPDFALMNFDFAYRQNIERKKLQKDLLSNLKDMQHLSYFNIQFAFTFQGCASTCIISLFTAIECFINDLIPKDYMYSVNSSRKTEVYNKKQIQESISFTDKLTKVLPTIFNKNFFTKPTPTNTHIYNLRDLRNDIIHIKSDPTGLNHAQILTRLLSFKYDQTFESVAKLFNFYKDNFVEECPCDKDF